MKAITVKQPWAWAIAHGGKDVENRTWGTGYRGPLAIHAGAGWDADGAWNRHVIGAAQKDQQPGGFYDPPLRVEFDTGSGRTLRLLPDGRRFILGAIVALAELVDVCAVQHGCTCGPWAIDGQYHWRLANVRPLAKPVPCKGRLGLWGPPEDVEAAVMGQLAAAEVSGEAATR
jgi:hypothetical protein